MNVKILYQPEKNQWWSMNFSILKFKEVMLKDHFPRRHLKITVSPLGIATHKYSGKKRLIFDLSSPHNNTASMNLSTKIYVH